MRKMTSSVKARILSLSLLLILSILFSVSCSGVKTLFAFSKETTVETTITSATIIEINEELQAWIDASDLLEEVDYNLRYEPVTTSYLYTKFTMDDPEELAEDISQSITYGLSYENYLTGLTNIETNLDMLKTIDPTNLSQENRILYDVLIYDMETILDFESFFYFRSPFNSYSGGIQSDLPLDLMQIEFTNKESIEDYLLLIRNVYIFLEDCMDFERERSGLGLTVSDKYLDILIENCQSVLEGQEDHFMKTSFSERLATVEGLTEEEKLDFTDRHNQALDNSFFPAFEMLIEGFTELKGTSTNTGGICYAEGGKEFYAAYFKLTSGLDISPYEAIDIVDKEIDECLAVIDSFDMSGNSFEDFCNTYFSIGTIQENIDFCIDNIREDFPELPEHDLIILHVPGQLEDFSFPAAYYPCTIDDPETNIIMLNDSALENDTNILNTLAHEGYPGHLYECLYHVENIENFYQRETSFFAYSEGWAEYSGEYMLKKTDFDSEYIKLENAYVMLDNLVSTRIDLGINFEGWDKAGLKAYLKQFDLDYKEYIDWIWDVAIEVPCYSTPYCFGQLETIDIIEEAVEKLGEDVPMIDIHTAYLQIGPAPFKIIEKYMDEFTKNA